MEPFLGEIRIMAFGFAPKGWALCNGQLLPINQNQALFALLGTQYGGNGITTFALPNLQGRMPLHVGPGYVQGQSGGEQTHTLTNAEMPAHGHGGGLPAYTGAATSGQGPVNARFADAASQPYRIPTGATQYISMQPSVVGSSQPHTNMQPYLALNCCIALQGIFPSRN
jgi:microcystin-dependent protein